jgi:uncharacterized protein with von Willebrand factor type A (vWA) domain
MADPPSFAAARDDVLEELVRFVRALRRAGADVPANAAKDAAGALVELGFDDRDAVRAGLRATLVTRREDVAVFDRLFPAFHDRLRAALDDAAAGVDPPRTLGSDGPDAPDGRLADLGSAGDATLAEDGQDAEEDGADADRVTETTAWSGEGAVESGDAVKTAAYSRVGTSTPMEVDVVPDGDDVDVAVDALLAALGGQRGRRWARGGSGQVDVRRALRRSSASAGALVEVPERERRRDAVRTTFLVDVSRSVLDAVDRGFLVRFLRAAVAGSRSARVFLFDTDCREATDAFDEPTVDAALAALSDAEATWGGGTRIGSALSSVRERHPDAVDRDATVFVVSDGLERGEVDRLEAGMAWLAARAAAVLWLNPLAAAPSYEPATRGMAAALPYVDGLFAFTGPGDVAELARQLRTHGSGRSVGYRHDPRRRRQS